MIKADVVRQISALPEYQNRPVPFLVDAVLDSLKEVINRHGRLELRDFGVFTVKTRKARIGRNPRNLAPYPIPGRRVVTFKMGREFKQMNAGADSPASPQDKSAPHQT